MQMAIFVELKKTVRKEILKSYKYNDSKIQWGTKHLKACPGH